MRRRLLQFCSGGISRPARGFTLVEIVIGVIVLALLTATIPPLMVMITKTEFTHNEQRVAERLTRNQMEFVKGVSYKYKAANETNPYGTIPDLVETYTIEMDVQPVQVFTTEYNTEKQKMERNPLPQPSPLPPGLDEGIQELTVSVYHVDMDRPVLVTKGYKVDR